jgi:small conductance mechanosensitive channel
VAQIAKYEQALALLQQPDMPPAKPETPPTTTPKTEPPKPPDTKTPTIPGVPGVPGMPGMPAVPTSKENPPAKPKIDDAEVREARATAEKRRAALAEAEEKAKSVEDRVQVLQQLIATEERLLAAERKVADQAEEELAQLTRQSPTTPPEKKPALNAQIAETQQRLSAARDRIAAITDRLSSLNEDLHGVQDERIQAMKVIDDKRKEAEEADREVTRLENPFTLRNLNKWAAAHAMNMILIVVGVVALHLVVRLSSRQIVRLVARNSNRGTDEDRENRANTLVGVFRYATTLTIFGSGIVMLLDEAGIPVVPLMGGAAVLGLAVAFGAQNLIKDYFSGFMILLEDQYGVNDVVKIGSLAGLVEKITLRVTVLRDLEGVLHFIPHGQVTAVSNMTHGWSRALFDIPVPHTAELDLVMNELIQLGRELRKDPLFSLKILDDPEMLGVETLDATASTVRFLVKTRPLQQWTVKRELLKRIKLRLSELGIELPPPRRTFEMVLPSGNGNSRDSRHESARLLWPGTETPTGT